MTGGRGTLTPTVSIGLPVFDGASYLPQAIDSILRQDYADFELVISDNGSTDATEEIGRDYAGRDRRVVYVRHPLNRGGAWNFNYVVAVTSGPLFKWAAHDDLLEPTWLSRCVAALTDAPDAVVAYTRRIKIDAGGKLLKQDRSPTSKRLVQADSRPGERFADLVARAAPRIETYGLNRRATLERTRLFLSFPASEQVLLAELLLRGRFVEVAEPLFLHRDHSARATRRYRTAEAQNEWLDPRRMAVRNALPTWRLGVEFGRAIRRSPIEASDRNEAYVALARWMWRRRLLLADNLLDAARVRLRRQ